MAIGPVWNRIRYTLYAPVYDWALRRLAVFRRGLRRAFELARLRPGERVLLVACGTGLDLELIPAGVDVTAIHITPAMVERSKWRARRLAISIEARVMDAAALEVPDESYDCVVLHLTLAVVPDPVTTIRTSGSGILTGTLIGDALQATTREPAVRTARSRRRTGIHRHASRRPPARRDGVGNPARRGDVSRRAGLPPRDRAALAPSLDRGIEGR